MSVMDLNDAKAVALSLMNEHGVSHYSLKFTPSFSFAGRCNYTKEIIELNPRWVERADGASVRNTILHEIAHALCGPRAAHGYRWFQTFTSIGGNGAGGTRDFGVLATKRYVLKCTMGCDNLGYRQRRDPRLLANRVCKKHHAPLQYAENA